jgi:hypothetical protein
MNSHSLIGLASVLLVIISGVIRVMWKQSQNCTDIDNLKQNIERIDKNFKDHELLNERAFDKYEKSNKEDFSKVFQKLDDINKNLNEFIISLLKEKK